MSGTWFDHDPDLAPCKGAIAVCSIGLVGLITSDSPQEITYTDGNKGMAWLGVQLKYAHATLAYGPDAGKTVHVAPGQNWSSRNPKVLGYVDDLLGFLGTPPVYSKVWHCIPEFAQALWRHLQYRDDPRWGDTWLKRTRRGQEERTINNFKDKFDKFLNGREKQPIDWLAIAGDAMICWFREQHPEIWPE